MPTFRASAALAAAALAFAGAAAARQETPESILPPGFGDAPTAAPVPRPSATGTNAPAVAAPATPGATPTPSGEATPTPTPTPTSSADLAKLAAMMAEYELPSFARRSLDQVGLVSRADGGLPADGFGVSDGQRTERLMRRLDGTIASRWLAIALRRALVSALDTPNGVNGADFAAERSWLLLRMGESVAARDVVQAVDERNFTPKLYQVAMQAALATGDPAGLCGVADRAMVVTPEPGWQLAQAMCAALAGDARRAKAQVAAVRRQHRADGVDLQLAQKVVGAGPGGGQAMTIEWAGVDQLDAWRFGLAAATGVAVPDSLYATVGPQVAGWRALAPGIAMADRAAPAETAAARGVLSNLALVDLYGAIAAGDDQPAVPTGVAADLRDAYTAASPGARRAALSRLWGAAGQLTPYARLVLTARAAARVRPAADDADADRLVAAMLSAGLDRTALRWRGHVADGGDAWAMLTLADPDATDRVPTRAVAGYAGAGDAVVKRRLFFAGLAGLGRLGPDEAERIARSLEVRVGDENAWTRALDAAAARREPGSVLLLCAIGMQTGDWRGVSPEALYRIVAALRQVGLGGEARMIAAEAIARA